MPTQKRIRIISSFKGFDAILAGDPDHEHIYSAQGGSLSEALRMLWRARWTADYLVFEIDHKRLLLACALFTLISPRPFRRCRIVSVDLLLKPPFSFKDKLVILVKRVLLRQVDLFLLYFKDIDGYVKHYGIPRARTRYVPFKVNSWEKLKVRRDQLAEGEYVLLSGATLRDHATFVEAIRLTGLPAVLLIPGQSRSMAEQADWFRKAPPSLKIEFHTDGKEETYLRYFERARIVCFPRFKWDIASTGISGYLCSMGLGRCVAISRGPGAEDVLADDEAALFFEPESPQDLARVLKTAWESPELCRKIAANGARYAEGLEGEQKLLRNILKELARI